MARSTRNRCFAKECKRGEIPGKLQGYGTYHNVSLFFFPLWADHTISMCAVVVTQPQEDFGLIERAAISKPP